MSPVTPISSTYTREDLIAMIHNRDALVSDLKTELNQTRFALGEIAGGSFPGASNLAMSGSWQIFVDNLQAIATAALPARVSI